MNFNLLLYITLAFSMLIYVIIGQQASQTIQNSDDYYLMGKGLSFFPLMMTLLATQLGGGTLIGVAEKAYQQGWIVLLYPLGLFLGFIFLGLGFGNRLRKLGIQTIPAIFETLYGSRTQKYIASSLSIISLFFILVAQGIALKQFFISIQLTHPIYLIVFWVLLTLYTVMGGLKAVVNTDVIQAFFIVVMLIITFIACYWQIGIPMHATNLSASPIRVEEAFTQWLLMPFIFMLIGQDMGQRFFAARDRSTVVKATLGAGSLLFFCSFIGIYLGIVGQAQGMSISKGSALVMVVQQWVHPFVATLCIVAIFMAVISTADSVLFAVSSNIFCDFIVAWGIADNQKVKLAKLITFIVGLLALLLAFLLPQVINTTVLAYSLSVCTLGVPIILAMWIKKPQLISAYASMVAGSSSFLVQWLLGNQSYMEAKSIALSLVAYLITHALSSQSSFP